MPILKFYTNPGQLTDEEKQELAAELTSRYATLMPAFFVNIMFHELPTSNFFVGGKPTNGTFVRFTAEHIALNYNGDLERANRYLDYVGELFTDKFESRGWTWEYSVMEGRRELWRVQSLVPPQIGTEALNIWKEAGRGVPWEG